MRAINDVHDFIFVLNLRDNFDVGLLAYGFEHQLPHQPGPIRDDNSDELVHVFRSVLQSVQIEFTLLVNDGEKGRFKEGSARVPSEVPWRFSERAKEVPI